MPRTKTTKSPATDVAPPIEVIPYERAVREGQEIVLEIEATAARGQLRLGELAHKVETKYKDRTLAKFAGEIGISACTLARYRDVYRAWANFCAPGRKSIPSYAVLRELATHPDREEMIRKHPNLTKREAHNLMRKRAYATKEEQEQEQEEDWVKHNRVWFKELCKIAQEASRTAAAVGVDKCTPEQQENLRQAVDPNLLMYLRASGRMLIHTADSLAALCGLDPKKDYDPIPVTPEASSFQMAAE
jgi:hypothetical protein